MSQQVQDPAIIERRLRPIYDNLEVGNNRKALQEAEKLLKKNPNVLCIKALKGLAQLRLGRFEESHSLLKMVAEEHPTDGATLQVLSFCYKELEQLDKIVDIYNYAVKQQPNNEELLAHLFISYVRLEDFKSQQTVALQLYKAHPKNAYYFWAVMSVLLQGVRGPESQNPTKRDIFLALAQRMVDKMIQEDKLESEQEVHIYLQILRLQNKFKEALEFLNGSICNKLYPAAPIYMKITLFKELEMWKDCNSLLKTLLSEDPDRWDYHQDYLTSCFQLIDSSNHNHLSKLDECHEFLCQLIESAKKQVRGPYLARLELYKRLKLKNFDANELLGDFNELIVEYFHRFGDKSCCTHDIALFLPIVSLEDRQKLSSRLLLESGISCLQLPQTKEQMLKHICALQISRICGSHLDCHIDHLLALYTALKLHYEHGLSTFGKNLLITDMGPSDPYALLAANVMYDISQQQQKSDHVFEALCLLQYNLRNSSSNFHVKLFCLKIYHMLGCTFGAQEMYEYLDMKQIQLDSMGYIHCNPLSLSGRFSIARSIYDSTLKFYTSSYKERLDYLALTYRFGTFSKIEEFMNFKERLTHSLHYMATCVEVQLCDLVTLNGTVQQNLSTYTMMGIEPGEDHICWHKLTDNRDLAALVRWDPIHLVEEETERKDSQQQEIEILRIRSLLLRLIAAFVELFHPDIVCKHNAKSAVTTCSGCVSQDANHTCNMKTRQPKGVAIIESLMDAWRELFQRLRTNELKPLPNRFLVNLLPTRLHLLLELPVENFYYDLAQLVLQLNAGFNDLPMQCKSMSDTVVKVVDICIKTIKESNTTVDDNLWRRRKWQSTIAVCIEMLSLYSFTLSVIYEKLYAVGKVAKSKKKSTENSLLITEKERCQLLIELLKHLKLQLQCCDGHIESWRSPVLPRDLNSFMADMSLKPEVEANLISDVALVFKESHERMVSELRDILKDKMRMISK